MSLNVLLSINVQFPLHSAVLMEIAQSMLLEPLAWLLLMFVNPLSHANPLKFAAMMVLVLSLLLSARLRLGAHLARAYALTSSAVPRAQALLLLAHRLPRFFALMEAAVNKFKIVVHSLVVFLLLPVLLLKCFAVITVARIPQQNVFNGLSKLVPLHLVRL